MDQPPSRKWDLLIINANLATLVGDGYGEIRTGALAISNGRIAWLGAVAELPGAPADCAEEVTSAGGMWLTPGLVDCHTHLMFAGHRAEEFEQRLGGMSYQEIAARGGGIRSTVSATREATDAQLLDATAGRLRHLQAEGVTTVEIKSGYGLDAEQELRLLRAIRRLDDRSPLTVQATLLGAHAVPPEFDGRADDYIAMLCDEVLPLAVEEGLADQVDAYLEPGIGFERAQVERMFSVAQEAGLDLRLHADQFSDAGGAALAAELGARSADHLEYADPAAMTVMAAAGTVAVLLPGAFYFLGEQQRPPIDAMREAGVRMAVATDANPGSSPLTSMIAAMNMACVLLGLTPAEALRGATVNAAHALGMAADIGSLEVGKQADLALWDIEHPAELCYWLGGRRCRQSYIAGQRVF